MTAGKDGAARWSLSRENGSRTSKRPPAGPWRSGSGTSLISTYKPVLDDARYRSFDTTADYRRWCGRTSHPGLAMAARFEYRRAQRDRSGIREAPRSLPLHREVRGHLLGYPDTTQDADLFVEKSPENGRALVAALLDPGSRSNRSIARTSSAARTSSRSGRALDLDLVFAPDGIATFGEAAARALTVEGIRVCHIDDIIRSKEATGRTKDREALPASGPSGIGGQRRAAGTGRVAARPSWSPAP